MSTLTIEAAGRKYDTSFHGVFLELIACDPDESAKCLDTESQQDFRDIRKLLTHLEMQEPCHLRTPGRSASIGHGAYWCKSAKVTLKAGSSS